MKFGISITIDKKADHKSHLIIDLSEALKEYFQDKNYGEDIKDYIIGCICILPPEGFEKFNKLKDFDKKRFKNDLLVFFKKDN